MTTKTEREKHADEVDKLQRENAEERLMYRPAEVHVEVAATSASGEDEKVVEVHAFGGYAYLNTHGEARLGRDGLQAFMQHLEAAFQAVT